MNLDGPIDEVRDEQDVAEQPMTRRCVDQSEVGREESIEEAVTVEGVPMLSCMQGNKKGGESGFVFLRRKEWPLGDCMR